LDFLRDLAHTDFGVVCACNFVGKGFVDEQLSNLIACICLFVNYTTKSLADLLQVCQTLFFGVKMRGYMCLFATRGDEYFLHRLLFRFVHWSGVIVHCCKVNLVEVDVADGVVVCTLEVDIPICLVDDGGTEDV
jgi:hypothetical protein